MLEGKDLTILTVQGAIGSNLELPRIERRRVERIGVVAVNLAQHNNSTGPGGRSIGLEMFEDEDHEAPTRTVNTEMERCLQCQGLSSFSGWGCVAVGLFGIQSFLEVTVRRVVIKGVNWRKI